MSVATGLKCEGPITCTIRGRDWGTGVIGTLADVASDRDATVRMRYDKSLSVRVSSLLRCERGILKIMAPIVNIIKKCNSRLRSAFSFY